MKRPIPNASCVPHSAIRPKSSRVDLKCDCGTGWSGSVPVKYVDYVLDQWAKIHGGCVKGVK